MNYKMPMSYEIKYDPWNYWTKQLQFEEIPWLVLTKRSDGSLRDLDRFSTKQAARAFVVERKLLGEWI